MKRLFPLAFLFLTSCVAVPYGAVAPLPARVVFATPVRPYIHAVVILPDERLRVSYVPGVVTELQILASLQSYCADRGLRAYRVPGPTVRQTVRSRRGMPRSVLAFTVECR